MTDAAQAVAAPVAAPERITIDVATLAEITWRRCQSCQAAPERAFDAESDDCAYHLKDAQAIAVEIGGGK